MNSKVYNALCAAFALAYLLAPALLFIPVMLWEASPMPSAFCMAKSAKRRRPSMAGVGATPFVAVRPDGEDQVEAHKNVMPQTILGMLSNWVGSLWSTGSQTTGEPSGSLLSKRHGGIPGHMSVNDSSSEAEDVVCVGKSSVFFGAGLRGYVPHLLPLHKLGRGIATMVFPVNGVAGTCGETHADLDEGVSSELVDECDEAEVSVRLRFICDRFFSEGFAKPRLSARFLDAMLEEELNDSANKAHRDSLTEVAEPECGLVPKSAEETPVQRQESIQTPSGLNNAGFVVPKPKFRTVEGLNEAFALSSWQSANGFFGECLSTGLPTPMEIDDDLAWSEVEEVEDPMEIDDVAEVMVLDADCGEKLMAHTYNPTVTDLQYVSQSANMDCDTNDIPACVPQQAADDKMEDDTEKIVLPEPSSLKKYDAPKPRQKVGADEVKGSKEPSMAVPRPKEKSSKLPRPASQKAIEEAKAAIEGPESKMVSASCDLPSQLPKPLFGLRTERAKLVSSLASEVPEPVTTGCCDKGKAPKKKAKTQGSTATPAAQVSVPVAAPSSKKEESIKEFKSDLPSASRGKKVKTSGGDEKADLIIEPIGKEIGEPQIQPFPARNPASKPAKSSSNRGKEDPKSLLKYVLRFKGDPTVNKEGVVKESAKLMIPKTWTNFCCPVRFTKRTSCLSVGPGAKPTRSERKVDPETSGKLYGDTGIPGPFTVLFFGIICVVIRVGSLG
ncbi:hypothetical protein F4703DRAFT_1797535 [Phycomyces blakesleeanus]